MYLLIYLFIYSFTYLLTYLLIASLVDLSCQAVRGLLWRSLRWSGWTR